ncbi:MAG TPA: alpha/beta hydrolase [Acidimicrobiales bacterium]|nr:alpha/beta hydrolase [Acidimicrobiales bacterium]
MEHIDLGTGIELCYEWRGAPGDPVVVLIAGLGRQLIGWDDSFCQLLVDEGFSVLRFDNRDTGLSTHLEGGPPFDLAAARAGGREAVAYTLDDMADDTAGLLDALGIERAHIVGTSMGGMIAQTLAIAHPARVRSLCSIMSTTGADDAGRSTPEAMAVVMQRPATDRETYVSTELANSAVIGSRGSLVDESWRRRRFESFFDRGIDASGTARQIMAIVASGDRTAGLAGITVPTLVIHGDVDPLITLPGGEATARAISGAVLVVIPDMGHEIPPAVQSTIVEAIAGNARRADEASAPGAQRSHR